MSFKNKVVWVTGAGRGIGQQIALRFAESGASVIGLDLAFERDDVPFRCIRLDVSSPEAVNKIGTELLEKDGLDILVNGAGILRLGTIEKLSWEDWQQSLNVNAGAVFNLFRIAVPHFQRQRGGSIVSVVSTAREFLGEKASYVVGWMYFLNWAMTGIVDITAVALYMHYWGTFAEVPQWLFALCALGVVATMNMIGVKWFAEMEFWFALIKVAAISLFLIAGVVFLGIGTPVAGNTTGLHLITENGGMFPHGLLPALVLVQGVIFAFAGIELIGTAAGECREPEKMLPKAINNIILRIGLFYVGSVVLLVLLLPWNAYQAGQSPFVTFFSKLGVPYIGTIMNIVVLTAALSSLNSGLYSTGRILRSLSMGGSAPKFMAKMSSQQVPYAGILVTCGIYVIGVLLNYLVPSRVFEIVLNIASLGIISSWAFIIVCQMRLRKAIHAGHAKPVSFKMPGAPFTSWLTLAFLLAVVIMMAFDYPNGTWTIATIPVLAVLLVLGWFGLRKHAQEVKQEQQIHEAPGSH